MPTKAAVKPEVDSVDDSDEYEVVTASSQMVRPDLRKEVVRIPEVRKSNGKKVQIIMSELNGRDYKELTDADKVTDGTGKWTGEWDRSHQDIKLIAAAARDASGHRLWATPQAAIAELENYPLAVIRRLVEAANRVSAAVEDEEKK